jgi:hypothetical protein
MAVFVVGLALSSCGGDAASNHGDGSATSPSLAALTDERTVEQAVRGYLGAVAADDYQAKLRFGTGDLDAVAEWELMVALSFGSALGEVEVQRLEVASVDGDAATVELHAELRLAGFQDDPATVLSGPVSMIRTAKGWKVADYVRDGRSVAEGVFTRLEGRGEGDGVAVDVLGAHVAADSILVVLEATNASTTSYVLVPATILGPDGAVLPFGEPSGTQRAVLPSAPLETYVFWSGRSLAADARSFRLQLTFEPSEGEMAVDLDIPVTLID